MILPLSKEPAQNTDIVVEGSNAKGTGVPLIGAIDVLLVYALLVRLCFKTFESFVTPFDGEFLDSWVFGSNLLMNAFSHNFL